MMIDVQRLMTTTRGKTRITFRRTRTMEARGNMRANMTWLQYYQAVRRGDLETVQKAEGKDSRVALTMDKSAIELAALYGHTEMFEYFLQKVDKIKESAFLVRVLADGLRGGHVDIVKKLVPLVQFGKSLATDLYMAAFAGGSMECLKLVNNHIAPKSKVRNVYMQEIFYNTGSARMLRFMMKICRVDAAGKVAPIIGVPVYFVNVALNQIEQLQKDLEKNEQWHKRTGLWTPMDVAAIFGQLDALKMMADSMCDEQMVYFKDNMASTITYALRKNRKNILEYLFEFGIAKPTQPCEYSGFEINEAFFYLKEATADIKLSDYKLKNNAFADNFNDNVKVIHDYPDVDNAKGKLKPLSEWSPANGDRAKYWTLSTSATRLAKMAEFYEYLVDEWIWGKEVRHPIFDLLFMRSLSEQNVDAAIAVQKMTRYLDCHTKNFHKLFLKLMYSNPRKYGYVPSPVVLEILLSVVMPGETDCRCDKKTDLMEMFVAYSVNRSKIVRAEKITPNDEKLEHDQKLPLDVVVKRVEAVLEILINHGYEKPCVDIGVHSLLHNYFDMQSHWAFGGAHLLCFLQCCHIGHLMLPGDEYDVELNYPGKWFNGEWSDRNAFLTEFLLAISRNGRQLAPLPFHRMLLYVARPKKRHDHFINCFEKLGLSISDEKLDEAIDDSMGMGPVESLMEMMDLNHHEPPKLLSLQASTRAAIHRHCLHVAHGSPSYVSAKALVEALGQTLPKRLQGYLKYEDLFETMKFDDDGTLASGFDRAFDGLGPPGLHFDGRGGFTYNALPFLMGGGWGGAGGFGAFPGGEDDSDD